ncbi:MAG: DNA helicase RecQ [Candidatus Pacebacteria bacterium]|nr:DNA helicase RecQ [Candidatus Paceibacterota bacterium]
MKKLLKQYFGYDEFRPLQEEIVNHIVAGNDCFVLMPTGGGKSLCYQLPALKLDGMALVISPLIALMKDQVDALRTCGINAEFINSSLKPKQIEEIFDRIRENRVKILYVAPERFVLDSFREFLKTAPISLIAVDEAHCVSEWGHDFRPDYRHLSLLKELFPAIPLVALTATATERVREDIISQLKLEKARIFVSSFNRENLHVRVVEKKLAFPKLVDILQKFRAEPVIIYCFSRKDTETIARDLRARKFKARAYHAGLNAAERSRTQELFIKDEINIIVATIAFGMGIDKPDVRLVVHYTYPKTLEGYYQEIGRAGRDGLPSECVLFYTYADTRKHEFFIEQIEDCEARERAREKLREVMTYAELKCCRKKYLLRYFGEELKTDNCGGCDICGNKSVSDRRPGIAAAEPETAETYFDATTVSKKILSAVVRLENRFGRQYVVDVLLGKKLAKILENRHDRLSVYGIVVDLPEDRLRSIVDQLVEAGHLAKSEGMYPVLSITKKGVVFLMGSDLLELPKSQDQPSRRETDSAPGYNQELYEKLKILRKKLADKKGVPPFVIFGNATLQEMARYMPADENALLRITGVGAIKLQRFGKVFLAAINGFVKQSNAKKLT